MGTLYEDWLTFMIKSHSSYLRMRNHCGKICRAEQNSPFNFNNFFFKSCHLWDRVEKNCKAWPDRDDKRGMRTVCWIPKARSSSQYMQKLLLCHCKNGYANAPQCYVYRYIACLVILDEVSKHIDAFKLITSPQSSAVLLSRWAPNVGFRSSHSVRPYFCHNTSRINQNLTVIISNRRNRKCQVTLEALDLTSP